MSIKSIVYYFSGTGNSLVVARDLAARIQEAELRAIPDVMKSDQVPQADVVGLVFPVYMFGLPLMVARFCRRLRAAGKPYVFGVATGGMAGATLLQLKDILQNNGLTLSAGFIIRMPDNYTPLHGAVSEVKQRQLFEAAQHKVADIADRARKRAPGPIEAGHPLANFLLSRLLYKYGSRRIPAMDRSFFVTARCNGCGRCAKVCPVENIRLEGGKPTWLHHCEQCLACLHWCPEEAIQLGSRTEGRKRYRHPEVTEKDFLRR